MSLSKRNRRFVRGTHSRQLRLEPLEDRRLLAVITVTSLTDNLFIGDGVTLREAIFAANVDISVDGSAAGNGADTIRFDASLFGTPQTITLDRSDLDITEALTIDATALPQNVTIDANEESRIFNIIADTGDFTLAGLTLTGGRTTGDNPSSFDNTFSGGAVRSLTTGNLTLEQSTVSDNSTAGTHATGGGIFAFNGAVTLTDSTVSGNNTAGSFARGGGIATHAGNEVAVTLTNSTVSGNSTTGANASGGGIATFNGDVTLTLTDSTVSGNISAGNGGGISAHQGDVTLTGSTVSGNSTTSNGGFACASSCGGGIFTTRGNVTLTGSTVSGNTSVVGGGGIYSDTGDVTLTGSTVSGNTSGDVGGIKTSQGNVTLTDSTVSGNTSPGSGGGIGTGGGDFFYDGGSITLTGSTVSGNSSGSNGGGIRTHTGPVTLSSSTVMGNSAVGVGGGVFVSGTMTSPTFLIENSIIAGNTDGGTAADLRSHSGRILTINYSLIGVADNLGTITGNGNQTGTAASPLDPLLGPLQNNGGPTETHALLAEGETGSPAIDAGDPAAVAGVDGVPLFDQRGTGFDRIETRRLDIGAYELLLDTLPPQGLVVDTTTDIFDNDFTIGSLALREAIFFANLIPLADTITFDTSLSGETITLGGTELPITEAVTIDAMALASNVTIDAQENSRIFNITATTGDFTLAGVTLTGGQTTVDGLLGRGGAIRSLTTGSLAIDHSTVSDNSTTGFNAAGGAIDALGAVTLTRSTVSGNSTAGNFASGGGIRSDGAVTLTGSTVSGNSTAGPAASGGGIRSSGNVSFTQSTVSGNSTAGSNAQGGGVYSGGTATLTGSTVSGNSTVGSSANGGGITSGGDVTLNYSTVIDNSAMGFLATGGGIWNFNDSISITNSIVADNTAAGGMNDINPGTGFLDVNFSLIGDPSGTSLIPTGGMPGANGNIVGGDTVELQVMIDFAAFGDFELSDLFDLSYTIDGGSMQPLFTSSVDEAGTQSYTLEDGTIVMRNDPLLINGTTLSNEFQTLTATMPGATSGASVEIVLVASANGGGEGFVFRNIVVTELDSGSLVAQALATGSDLNVTFSQDDPDYGMNDDIFGIRSRTNPGTPGLPRPIVDDSVANPPDTDGIIRSTDVAEFFGVADTVNGTGNDTNIARWTLLAPSHPLDTLLGPLADNGGPTETHALLAGSPAIDAGDPTAMAGVGGVPMFDQRGMNFGRVEDGDGNMVARIDMGAYEVQPPTPSCDFDGMNGCNIDDIDAMVMEIAAGTNGSVYDLTNDGLVNLADRDQWLADAGALNLTSGNPFLLADSNLDGVVDGQDFLVWNANKFMSTGKWSQADWNADGITDGQDFLIWNDNKFQSSDAALRSVLPSASHPSYEIAPTVDLQTREQSPTRLSGISQAIPSTNTRRIDAVFAGFHQREERVDGQRQADIFDALIEDFRMKAE